jgi:hypothetical protein
MTITHIQFDHHVIDGWSRPFTIRALCTIIEYKFCVIRILSKCDATVGEQNESPLNIVLPMLALSIIASA